VIVIVNNKNERRIIMIDKDYEEKLFNKFFGDIIETADDVIRVKNGELTSVQKRNIQQKDVAEAMEDAGKVFDSIFYGVK
jgi:hypothetical protein